MSALFPESRNAHECALSESRLLKTETSVLHAMCVWRLRDRNCQSYERRALWRLGVLTMRTGDGYMNTYNFCPLPSFLKPLFLYSKNAWSPAGWLLDRKLLMSFHDGSCSAPEILIVFHRKQSTIRDMVLCPPKSNMLGNMES
jgi:hypothetical protein